MNAAIEDVNDHVFTIVYQCENEEIKDWLEKYFFRFLQTRNIIRNTHFDSSTLLYYIVMHNEATRDYFFDPMNNLQDVFYPLPLSEEERNILMEKKKIFPVGHIHFLYIPQDGLARLVERVWRCCVDLQFWGALMTEISLVDEIYFDFDVRFEFYFCKPSAQVINGAKWIIKATT